MTSNSNQQPLQINQEDRQGFWHRIAGYTPTMPAAERQQIENRSTDQEIDSALLLHRF